MPVQVINYRSQAVSCLDPRSSSNHADPGRFPLFAVVSVVDPPSSSSHADRRHCPSVDSNTRITLHAAHFAHALGDTERAGVCYRVAKSVDDETNAGTGSHLKFALSLSTLAGENHLRALLLAQVGAQYLHTAPAHAMETLAVCETLGAGMGAKQKEADVGGKGKGKEKEKISDGNAAKHDLIGNALLRLWVGERFLDTFKRANKPHRVVKQEAFNVMYWGVVDGMVGRARWPSMVESDQDGAEGDG
ncbi:hypothetical protein BDR05DRAFT_1005266 [Suillus weaverae]|nr:hypothetical protein BDR05DRAFT_1005266 [Suillus weaverae]